MRRVVITGAGVISPVGNDIESFWDSLVSGRHGIGPITGIENQTPVKVAAQVKDFDPTAFMDKKAARRMEQFCQFAVAATKQALEDAKVDMAAEDPYRVGVSVGSGIGSLQAMEREVGRLTEKGPGRVGPLLVPLMISNMAAGNVSIAFGLKGKNINVVTACATGTNSIGEAFRTIQYGDADIMVAGGTESSITPIGIAGFSALTALTECEDVDRCSIPFDKDRSGFVMGEGSGIVILEELEHAKKRGAKIYAEVIGYGCSADAFHITSPAEDGSGAARAMLNALSDGNVKPEELTYINAHGTSTHHNDLFETRAVKYAFGEHAMDIRINSTKSMIGHLLGAAGAVEFITCVKEVQEGFIHKTVGLTECEEEMDLDYCKESYAEEVPYALSNSLGFGGHNASILIRKYEA